MDINDGANLKSQEALACRVAHFTYQSLYDPTKIDGVAVELENRLKTTNINEFCTVAPSVLIAPKTRDHGKFQCVR